jgi:hypothetical protein
MKYEQKQQSTNPWFILFVIIAIAFGCILFGNYIKGEFSDPISTGFGNVLMNVGTTIIIALTLAGTILLGIVYLIYWLFYKPRYNDPYQ